MLRSVRFLSICTRFVAPTRGAVGYESGHHLHSLVSMADFSSRSGSKRRVPVKKSVTKQAGLVPVEKAWVEVKDDASGLSYWWNKQTDETTHLGAPKPLGATALAVPPPNEMQEQQQQGGAMSGLGGVLAQGMAFGVGSSIAHHAVGAIANSFGGDDDDGGDGGVDI